MGVSYGFHEMEILASNLINQFISPFNKGEDSASSNSVTTPNRLWKLFQPYQHSLFSCLMVHPYLYMLPKIAGTLKVGGRVGNRPGGERADCLDFPLAGLLWPSNGAKRRIFVRLC